MREQTLAVRPVILSGGSGSRLWPMSREHMPKQLLPICGELSMLQETVQRLLSLRNRLEVLPPIVVCNQEYRFLIAEQLRQIGVDDAAIILEPEGKNTAPALTLAAMSALEIDDAVMLVTPADHVIKDTEAFLHSVEKAVGFAQHDCLVTFGVVPTSAETGYGYIKEGEANGEGFAISKFVEKPNKEVAQSYLESGDYLWNSGMFVMKASVWQQEIKRFKPSIFEVCQKAMKQAQQDLDFIRVDKEMFSTCEDDSIDYAVMEPIVAPEQDNTRAVVVPLDSDWSDVGAWSSVWDVSEKDGDGNVVKGDVYIENTANCLFSSEYRLVAGVGLQNIMVIETADVVMVADKSHAQDVKKIVQRLKTVGRSEYQVHRRVYRPWGSYEGIDAGERFQVKRIIVNPGASLSLQMHYHRAEHWIVVRGTAEVTRGDEVQLVTENKSTYIPIGVQHRLRNPGKLALEMIEVQSGAYLGEDDIVRFEDVYGREK